MKSKFFSHMFKPSQSLTHKNLFLSQTVKLLHYLKSISIINNLEKTFHKMSAMTSFLLTVFSTQYLMNLSEDYFADST